MTSNIFRIQNNNFDLQLLNNEQFPLFMQNYSKKRTKKLQAVTLSSAKPFCLASVIGRELAHSTWYGRWRHTMKISHYIT